jgi:hypothetical protein
MRENIKFPEKTTNTARKSTFLAENIKYSHYLAISRSIRDFMGDFLDFWQFEREIS